jgi:hypothetical protein
MSAWRVSNPLHPGPEADAMTTVPPLSPNERSFEAAIFESHEVISKAIFESHYVWTFPIGVSAKLNSL